MKVPQEKEIVRELRYGHMASSGFAKWVNGEWQYDWDGYEKYLRSLDLTEAEIEHITGKYNREVDLGKVEAAEKLLGG